MCGVAGVLVRKERKLAIDRLKGMVDAVAHRGPDDAGYLLCHTGRRTERQSSYGQAFADERFRHLSPLLPAIDSPAGQARLHEEDWDLFLGHRRLAIQDLTPRGHQPMSERTQQLWLTYNGEIYNFEALKAELAERGHRFSSRSDTEVLLHAYEEWGEDFIPRLNGMFAFALWDGRRGRLVLARDRYGIKPLYYELTDEELVFGSEIKSIRAYRETPPRVDLLALNEYFSFQNVFSDRTLFDGVRMLPAGHILTLDARAGGLSLRQYWDFDFTRDAPEPEEELRERLYGLLQTAVKRQTMGDVLIGSYLSGGIDSGTVTALATRNLGRIPSFTGGCDISEAAEHEKPFDERRLAERMASVFQTEHYEFVLHQGDLEAALERLVWHLEDLRVGQCYPNYYISRLAGKFVKVVLSGAGGDELFGGYPWRYATAVGPSANDYVENYYRYWKRLVRDDDKPRLFSPAVTKGLFGAAGDPAAAFAGHTRGVFRDVLRGGVQAATLPEQINYSLYFECKTFLHGLLVVEDKLSMAHSLETRLPLLDNDLVDFACRVPIQFKISGLDQLEPMDENLLHKQSLYRARMNTGKNILRTTMERILPPQVLKAEKRGFSVPDESWFRGRSEEFVRRTLLSDDARLQEYIDQGFIRERVLTPHSSGAENHRLLIWSLLSFETWLKVFRPAPLA